MPEEKEEMIPEIWVYTGRALLVGNKLGHGFVRDDGKGTTVYLDSGKKGHGVNQRCIIGHRYEVPVLATDSSKIGSSRKWKGAHPDSPRWMECEANSRADLAKFNGIKNHKAAKRTKLLYAALEPIRLAYHATNSEGQQAILAMVIRAITARSPLPTHEG